MRLKQVLVLVLSLGVFSATGDASVPQLSRVSVTPQGNATVVTLHVNGAFTHNEYRLADDLLLIDLIGVAAKVKPGSRTVQAPGLDSYSVAGCLPAATGAMSCPGGVQTARVKLTLASNPEVRVNSGQDGLVVEVLPAAVNQGGSTVTQPSSPESSAPGESGANAAPAVPAAGDSSRPAEVRNVAVIQGTKGSYTTIEVSANAPIKTRSMKLKSPERIVVDLLNATPAERPQTVPVNSKGVLDVRMGQFQNKPPITRLVVDLSEACTFEIAHRGNKLLVQIQPSEALSGTSESEASPAPPASAPVEPAYVPATLAAPPAPSGSALAPPAAEASPAVAEVSPTPAPAPARANQATAEQAAPSVTPKAETPLPAPAATPAAGAPAKAIVLVTPTEAPLESPTPALGTGTAEPESKSGAPAAKDLVVVQPKIQEHVSEQNPEPAAATLLAENAGAPVPPPATSAPPAQNAPAEAAKPKTQPEPGVNFAAEQRSQEAAPAATPSPRYTGEPISVNLKDVDLKDFFRLIHEISGLNIVLDPNVSGSLTLVLDDVPWDQALDIVLKNNNLVRQLDGNVLRIATVETVRQEAEAHRHQVEAQMLAVDKVTTTRFLSYAHAKDVLPTIKRVLSPRGDIVADERTNGLVITDIPTVIAQVDKLLAQLDRKTQEVEIEARVIAATRSFARDIGTQFGFGWGNNPTSVGGGSGTESPNQVGYYSAPPYFTSPVVSGSSTTATPASIPLFSNLPATSPTSGISLLNLGSAYRVDSVLTAAEQRGLLKVLSRPRVITQNNIQAVIKQGQRVPITTLGQLNGPPTVTYIDAVLRLTVTPQITVENTIFLNVDIENTTPDYSNEIQGNPVFLTQQATTQVLVTNGGTVVIGGVLQTSNSYTIQQVPFLGSVPMLGNLFKRRAVNTSTQELIFFITPRILET